MSKRVPAMVGITAIGLSVPAVGLAMNDGVPHSSKTMPDGRPLG